MDNVSCTRLMSLCNIGDLEAQRYLAISSGSVPEAYYLFLLNQCVAPLSLEATSDVAGLGRFELKVAQKEKTGPGRRVGTKELTRWKEVRLEAMKQGGSDSEKCVICMCEFDETDPIVQLSYCAEHYFHPACIEACRGTSEFLKCPVCTRAYGIVIGDMPCGSLQIVNFPQGQLCIDGFPDVPTIVIQYTMPSGTQSGAHYSGTGRTAFFPATPEGIQTVKLLLLAFERRLTFTVGTSVTTGRQNAVVWNGIHHKTNVTGGPTRYGYPDTGYFFRVREELICKGISA